MWSYQTWGSRDTPFERLNNLMPQLRLSIVDEYISLDASVDTIPLT